MEGELDGAVRERSLGGESKEECRVVAIVVGHARERLNNKRRFLLFVAYRGLSFYHLVGAAGNDFLGYKFGSG